VSARLHLAGLTRLRRPRTWLSTLLAAALMVPMAVVPLLGPDVQAAAPPIRYDWDEPSLEGWLGENSVVSRDEHQGHSGGGSLRVSRLVSSAWSSLRVNERSTVEPRDITGTGRRFSAWVMVPAGTPGSWVARLNAQNGDWTWAFGRATVLTPGRWTKIRFTLPLGIATSLRRIGVQFEVTGGQGAVSARVDEVRQDVRSATTPPSSVTPTTKAPSPTTVAPTTAPPTTTAPPATVAPPPSVGWPTGKDALQRKALSELRVFTDWLAPSGAKGYIGEVGWPNDESTSRWNDLADTWYQAADATDLMVTAWATGEWWGGYNMAIYGNSGSVLGTALPPSEVVEARRGRAGADRGVNVNGAEFGIGSNLGTGSGGVFSNVNRGTYDQSYHYESQASLDYLASRGVELVRLPFRWERIQPTLGGALDATEVARLKAAIDRARDAGLEVIPTVMNYGAYWLHNSATGRGDRTPIGSSQVTVAHYADLWGRLAGVLGGHTNISGWGLMNEPTAMPGEAATWETASQSAVDAIRGRGDRKTIFVPGYNWSTAPRFKATHPGGPWVRDPAGAVRYEAHHYFDSNNSGDYSSGYDAQLSDAIRRGF
jgi:aryl-phospho-beta-D-glucosidase BglC (GH1 family)